METQNTPTNDPYLSTNRCVARMFREWQKHPRQIICVDYDDTCDDFHRKEGHTHEKVLALVRRAQAHNFYIVVWTASIPERYPMMISYLAERGITVDSINKNPIDLPFGNWGKIYYNILLDDRAGLQQACDTLEKTLDLIDQQAHNQTL